MAADTVISGVIRGILPYAALAGVGFLGYTWLNKNGYLDGIKGGIDSIAEVPSKIVDTIKDRTGADNFANGDWVGGAQKIVRNIPIVNLGEKGYNAAKDFVEDVLPDDPVTIPDVPVTIPEKSQEDIPESTWTDTPLKYVPAVAIRNGLTKIFGR